MAPYELILFSFLDAEGQEQDFTTTDPNLAQDHATRHRLGLLRNRYEFLTSEPVTDGIGNPKAPTQRQQPRRCRSQQAPSSPIANGPTREEVLTLLSLVYHQRLGHDLDCPCLHGGACHCLRREIAQVLTAAGLQS